MLKFFCNGFFVIASQSHCVGLFEIIFSLDRIISLLPSKISCCTSKHITYCISPFIAIKPAITAELFCDMFVISRWYVVYTVRTYYRAAYTVVTSRAFTISEVAADWHELMILQHTMWPSVIRDDLKWTSGAATDIPTPQSAARGFLKYLNCRTWLSVS